MNLLIILVANNYNAYRMAAVRAMKGDRDGQWFTLWYSHLECPAAARRGGGGDSSSSSSSGAMKDARVGLHHPRCNILMTRK